MFIHVYQLLLWLSTGWSSQKCCPTSLLLSAKLGSCTNYTTILTFPSIGVALSLVQIRYTHPCLQACTMMKIGWSSQKCCPASLLLSSKLGRCTSHHKTPVNKPFLTSMALRLAQKKISFYVYELLLWLNIGWSSKKCCPVSLLLGAKPGRFTNHHKTPTKKLFLTEVALSVVQIKCTYPCLHTFTMMEHWLKQPKLLPRHIAVDCQKVKIHQPPQNLCI